LCWRRRRLILPDADQAPPRKDRLGRQRHSPYGRDAAGSQSSLAANAEPSVDCFNGARPKRGLSLEEQKRGPDHSQYEHTRAALHYPGRVDPGGFSRRTIRACRPLPQRARSRDDRPIPANKTRNDRDRRRACCIRMLRVMVIGPMNSELSMLTTDGVFDPDAVVMF